MSNTIQIEVIMRGAM